MPTTSKRIVSLRDVAGTSAHRQDAAHAAASEAAALPKDDNQKIRLAHIPNLPQANQCEAMLKRIYNEFSLIIRQRGYNIRSVSELCCCGDGLDASSRKRRKMANNVLGYNQTTMYGSNKRHTIHLRLRDPRNHARLFSYEDVAGTMAHELAHCVHGPHNAQFYQLMDEIQEQHAVMLADGLMRNGIGAFTGGLQQPLGGSGRQLGGSGQRLGGTGRRSLGGRKLGGDAQFAKWLTPGQAAAQAAEARRLRDEQWCQPCSIQTASSDEEESDAAADIQEVTVTEPNERKPKAGQKRLPPTAVKNDAGGTAPRDDTVDHVLIDLTNDDNDKESTAARTTTKTWACPACTYVNQGGALALACSMCGKERAPEGRSSRQVALQLVRDEEIQRVRDNEVRQSKEQFGFNIYKSNNSK